MDGRQNRHPWPLVQVSEDRALGTPTHESGVRGDDWWPSIVTPNPWFMRRRTVRRVLYVLHTAWPVPYRGWFTNRRSLTQTDLSLGMLVFFFQTQTEWIKPWEIKLQGWSWIKTILFDGNMVWYVWCKSEPESFSACLWCGNVATDSDIINPTLFLVH